MELLLKIFAFGINLFSSNFNVRKIYYLGESGGPNILIRSILSTLLLAFVGSLIFYLLGRWLNLKKTSQWIIWGVILAVFNVYSIYNQLFEYVVFGVNSALLDIDWAFILSPIIWFVLIYIASSKLWMGIPKLTVFSKFTPSFLAK